MNISTDTLSVDSAAAASAATATTDAEDLEERFLTLLVTQMQNQDPLNPMDNAEVTSQLAQLSTVSGIETLNSTVEGLALSFGETQQLAAVTLVGRQVLVPGTQFENDGTGARLGVELTQSVDSLQVSIFDDAGNLVENMSLGAQPAGLVSLEWDGTSGGVPVAPGTYHVEVSAAAAGQNVEATALIQAQVASVTMAATGTEVELPGVGTVPLTDVKQVF